VDLLAGHYKGVVWIENEGIVSPIWSINVPSQSWEEGPLERAR
jgi:hypothetical protein